MVPENWVRSRLGLVAELQRGFDLPGSQRIKGSIPIVSSGGITGYHSEAKCKAPGVVTGRYGSIGDVFYLEENYWPLNTSLWVKDFHGNHEKFIYYLLVNFDFKKFSDKTGVPGVNRNDLHAVKVGVPPIPEQKKIAQILSTWDKAITTTEQLLANSQQQKKALMQQLLTGKKRLLNDNGARFSGEWKKIKLKQLFEFKRGKGLSKSALLENGKHKCILYGELFTRYPEVINEIVSTTNESNSIASVVGDILIPSSTTTTGIDLANATALLKGNVLLGGDINILRPKQDMCSPFFAYLLTHMEKNQIASFAQGITIIHLYGSDLKKLQTHIPPSVEEQQKIAAVLSAADQEITVLQQKLDTSKQEKKALMQQLLTGKRRVKINDKEVA